MAITGAGTVNPLARDVPGTFAAFQAGKVAIGPMDFVDIERLTVRIGAQIHNWDPEARFSRGRNWRCSTARCNSPSIPPVRRWRNRV